MDMHHCPGQAPEDTTHTEGVGIVTNIADLMGVSAHHLDSSAIEVT